MNWLLIAATAALMPPDSEAVTPVEIWTAGDTGLVQNLSVAVTKAFAANPRFSLSFGNKPGTIYVTVPIEALAGPLGNRVRVSASIGIAHAPPNAHQELVGNVSCWEDDMTACGQGAVALALKQVNAHP
jgi:hypothetical protein